MQPCFRHHVTIMSDFLEHLFVSGWNRLQARRAHSDSSQGGALIGNIVIDGQISARVLRVPWLLLAMSVTILGVTGSGKTRLIQSIIRQALAASIGLVIFSLHPDLLPFFLASVREREIRLGRLLTDWTIPISLADETHSAVLNILRVVDPRRVFVMTSEIAEMLSARWQLHTLGVRTAELLRNCLCALALTQQTLCEARPFLVYANYRRSTLQAVAEPEVRSYFEDHYDRLSEAQQGAYRAPVLNKLSEFTSVPQLRDVVGHSRSTFDFADVLNQGRQLNIAAEKSFFGPQAATLLNLMFIKYANTIFSHAGQNLNLAILDEAQNFQAARQSLETCLTEGRKTRCGTIVAAQTAEQFDSELRAALLGAGTQVFFRLSGPDAEVAARYLDGGKRLAERLRHLPQRHAIVKVAEQPWQEVVVPLVPEPSADYIDLYRRCRARWLRPRAELEEELNRRHAQFSTRTEQNLSDWE